MFKTELMTELLTYLLDNDIKLTLSSKLNNSEHCLMPNEKLVYVDLNTNMKSHIYLYEYEGSVYADMRYEQGVKIESLVDLLYCAKDAICGRDFMSYNWQDLLEKEGYIKVETKQVQTIKTL